MKVTMCVALALAFCGLPSQLHGQCVNSNGPASQFGPEQTYQGVYSVANSGATSFTEDGTGKVWGIEDACALLYRHGNQHLAIKARVRTMASHSGTTIALSVDSLVSVLGPAPATPAPPTSAPAGQSPCALLTAAEVSSAIGSSVKEGVERVEKRYNGQNLCAW